MKILFLPENIASMPAVTAEVLNKNDNIEAVCLTNTVHKYQSINSVVVSLNKEFTKSKFINKAFLYIWRRTKYKKEVKKWIEWADVLHYTWSPALKNGKDLAYAKKLNKPIFVEWVGSDIRNPEFLQSINPYYKHAFHNGYEYAHYESKNQSESNQKLFSSYKAVPLLSPEMSLYVQKKLFPDFKLLFQRLDLQNLNPQFPEVTNQRPLIIHSPSAKVAKGSDYIVSTLKELKKEYSFDFILLHDIPRSEVLAVMQKADIFIDQIIIGGYGMATMEAMSFGKPVMCYLLPQVFEAGLPSTCPIINTNPDNLKENLIDLITNPPLRNQIGIKSRAYVEEYHDANKIGLELLAIYRGIVKRKVNSR